MDITKKIDAIALHFFNGNNVNFANRLETSEANIRNYRSRIVPKVDFIVRMCNELEISFDWLFNDKGPMIRKYGSQDSPLPIVNETSPPQEAYSAEIIRSLKEKITLLEKTIQAQDTAISTLKDSIEILRNIDSPSHPQHPKTNTESSQPE